MGIDLITPISTAEIPTTLESVPFGTLRAFEALFEIGDAVQSEDVDLDQVLELVVRKAAELLRVDLSWIALLNRTSGRVEVVTSVGARSGKFNEMAVEVGAGLGGVALDEGHAVVVLDYTDYTANTPAGVHEIMVEEGVASVICAPMFRCGEMVGALYVANRRRTDFADEEVSLISAVATQASAAIRHTQLFHELEIRNELLENSFAVHRELTSVGLREAGLDGIGEALAAVIQRELIVEQDVIAPYRRSFGDQSPCADAAERTLVPISAGENRLGQILVSAEGLTELHLLAIDQGATVIALELLKQRAAREVEWRLRGELLDELLEGAATEMVLERAERLGVDVAARRRIFAFESIGGSVHYGDLLGVVRNKAGRRMHNVAGSILAVKRAGTVLLALQESTPELESELIDDIREALRHRGARVAIGISDFHDDLSVAFTEASACLALASQQSHDDDSKVLRTSDLGPLSFLLDSSNLDGSIRYVRDELGPLIDHDAKGKSQLLPTLRAYVDAGGHQPTVAKNCYIHVSTLKYRLKKIRELLGRDPALPEVTFKLQLAFKLMAIVTTVVGEDLSSASPPARLV